MTNTRYVVDTSSLLDLIHYYPKDIFPGIWVELDLLIKSSMMVAPVDVKDEIERGRDDLLQWVKEHESMFYPRSNTRSKIVNNILKEHGLVKEHGSLQADPWIVALAIDLKSSLDLQIMIVTEEKIKGNKTKIPFIAKNHGIESISMLEMFRREQWQFYRIRGSVSS